MFINNYVLPLFMSFSFTVKAQNIDEKLIRKNFYMNDFPYTNLYYVNLNICPFFSIILRLSF